MFLIQFQKNTNAVAQVISSDERTVSFDFQSPKETSTVSTPSLIAYFPHPGSTKSIAMEEMASMAVLSSTLPSPYQMFHHQTLNMVKSRMDEPGTKVSEEPGIGERSFYAASDEGSMYVFLKGNKVVGVAVGGPGAPKAAAVKDALKKSALAAAAKL